MRLIKFVVALGVAILLSATIATVVSTLYAPSGSNYENYQIIYSIIIFVLAMITLFVGYKMLDRGDCLSSGLIGAGVLTMTMGSLLGAMMSVVSMISSLGRGSVSDAQYLSMVFSIVFTAAVIFIAVKVDGQKD